MRVPVLLSARDQVAMSAAARPPFPVSARVAPIGGSYVVTSAAAISGWRRSSLPAARPKPIRQTIAP